MARSAMAARATAGTPPSSANRFDAVWGLGADHYASSEQRTASRARARARSKLTRSGEGTPSPLKGLTGAGPGSPRRLTRSRHIARARTRAKTEPRPPTPARGIPRLSIYSRGRPRGPLGMPVCTSGIARACARARLRRCPFAGRAVTLLCLARVRACARRASLCPPQGFALPTPWLARSTGAHILMR